MTLNPPQDYRKVAQIHRIGLVADRPDADNVLPGTLYFSTDTSVLERSNGSSWESYSPAGGGGGGGNFGPWSLDYSNAIVEPPTSNQVRFDALHPYTAVTKVWIRDITTDGQDIHGILMLLKPGSSLYVQDKNDHSLFALFTIEADPISEIGYVEIPVSWQNNGGALLNNQNVEIVAAAPAIAGPVGPPGPVGPEGPIGPQGIQGETGPKGDTGETGPVGPKGDKGDIGNTGPQGPKGDTGEQGPPGTIGPHASTHNAVGSDPVSVLNLAGFPGGTTSFLRSDGTFATPISTVSPHAPTHHEGGSDLLGNIQLRGGNPFIRFYDTAGATDSKAWLIQATGNVLLFGTNNDAISTFSEIMRFNRSGGVAANVALQVPLYAYSNINVSGSGYFDGFVQATADGAAVALRLKGRPGDNFAILNFLSNTGDTHADIRCRVPNELVINLPGYVGYNFNHVGFYPTSNEGHQLGYWTQKWSWVNALYFAAPSTGAYTFNQDPNYGIRFDGTYIGIYSGGIRGLAIQNNGAAHFANNVNIPDLYCATWARCTTNYGFIFDNDAGKGMTRTGGGVSIKDPTAIFFSAGGQSSYIISIHPTYGQWMNQSTHVLPVDEARYLGYSGFRWYQVWSLNGTIQTSDARDKDILGTELLGLNFINKLQPIRYRWKEGVNSDPFGAPRKTKHGIVAQQLLATLEELGEEFDGLYIPQREGERFGINYSELIGPIVKAIQELSQRLSDAEARIH